MKSAAIAANFLFANVILIPSCLAILAWRSQLTFDQLQAIVLMIVGTILASSVGRVVYQISLTVTGGDNGFVTMFWNLVPALTAVVSLILSHWIADEHFAINPTFFLGSAVIGASLVLFSLKSCASRAGAPDRLPALLWSPPLASIWLNDWSCRDPQSASAISEPSTPGRRFCCERAAAGDRAPFSG